MTYYAVPRAGLVDGEQPGAWGAVGDGLERAKAQMEGTPGEKDEVLVEDILRGRVWSEERGCLVSVEEWQAGR